MRSWPELRDKSLNNDPVRLRYLSELENMMKELLENETEIVEISVTKETLEYLTRAAMSANMTVEDFVIAAAILAAEEVTEA